MNQKNVEFLKEGLKYLGFGEGLNDKLTENVAKQPLQFQLKTENQYGPDKVNYLLDFKKGDQSDMYFFNRYTASLKEGTPEEKSQAFFPKRNSGITAKEAYNLLSGRAVNKDLVNTEGKPYNAWLQLDFNQKDNSGNHKFRMIHEGYGYNLQNELQRHPIKELSDTDSKEKLVRSLERGNQHQVTFMKGDKEQKMHIEANPQFKTLNIYDESHKKVFQENSKKESGQDKNQKKEAVKAISESEDDGGGKKQRQKKLT